MKKIGIFYGSTTGTTENIARKLAALLSVDSADVHDVAKTAPSAVGRYDILVLGTSTWATATCRKTGMIFFPAWRCSTSEEKRLPSSAAATRP